MITRCAWCDSTFPNNDGVETLPVGRRIAFDEQRGRLWVVCRRCERWNLVPMEERWEAIEECARTFQQSRLCASTDQIGLARLADGTALIRIGRPVRAEFAAWRYGDQFGRRRTRAIIGGVAAAAAVGAGAAGALVFGASLLGILPLFQVVTFLSTAHTAGLLKRQQPLDDPDHGGQVLPIGHPRLIAAPESDGGWGLDVPYVSRTDATGAPSGTWWDRHLNKSVALGSLRLVGAPARLLLSRHAPRLNTSGAPSSRIRGAVELIATAGGADQLPGYLARNRARFTAQQTFGDSGELPALPSEVRLALEMAAHEEVERALVEGELAALEHQWRGAEEEAAISDDLLLPPGVRLSLDRIRREQDDSSKS